MDRPRLILPEAGSRQRPPGPSRRALLGMAAVAPLLAACGSSLSTSELFQGSSAQPAAPPQQPATIGAGKIRVGLILPLSAQGNAAVAAQSLKNAADLALAEFQNPDIQLLVKDDGGNAQAAQQAAQQAVDEGAEIILGPLFAVSVPGAAQPARGRGIPVIAFSTDSSVAGRGVYLLSFLPESDVNRIVEYAARNGKRSFAAMLPSNAYGNVVEIAFKQAVARHGGRIMSFERYGDAGQMQAAARNVVQSLRGVDSLFVADDGDMLVQAAAALQSAGADFRSVQLLGTGLWDSPQVFAAPALQNGWYAAPDAAGFRAFAGRYRSRFGGEPVRTATLAYDAVALVAALAKTQGPQRFSEQILTNASGFTGIDGLFRFRADGGNERGLAVMKVTTSGPQVISAAPKSFGTGT